MLGEAERACVSLSITILNRMASNGLQQAVHATGFLQQPHQDSVSLVVVGSARRGALHDG